jgi:CyaY protein
MEHPQIVMTDTQFLDRAELLLKTLEEACDRLNEATDADIDNQRVGGMITLTFSNATQIIVNLQKPLHEIWLAARSGGYHFRFDGHSWQDSKGQGEFFVNLDRCASEQAGAALNFAHAVSS